MHFTSPDGEHKTRPSTRRRSFRRGSVLIETVVALTILAIVSLTLFKGTLNTLAPRQWSLTQNISDAYLTYEKAYAERLPFEQLTAAGSPWPVYPTKTEENVVLGTLPGGRDLSGKVIRTRKADPNNLPAHGGSGTETTNPSEMQTWTLQSLLVFKLHDREYVKVKSIVRTQ